jgi:hypothetical protein
MISTTKQQKPPSEKKLGCQEGPDACDMRPIQDTVAELEGVGF